MTRSPYAETRRLRSSDRYLSLQEYLAVDDKLRKIEIYIVDDPWMVQSSKSKLISKSPNRGNRFARRCRKIWKSLGFILERRWLVQCRERENKETSRNRDDGECTTDRRNEETGRVRFEIFATVARGLPWAIPGSVVYSPRVRRMREAFPPPSPPAVRASARDPPCTSDAIGDANDAVTLWSPRPARWMMTMYYRFELHQTGRYVSLPQHCNRNIVIKQYAKRFTCNILFLFPTPVAVLRVTKLFVRIKRGGGSDVTLVAAAFSTYLIFCTFSGRDSGHPRDDAVPERASPLDGPNIFRAA